ncbi:hypothetical protein IMY05_012G0047800 [Salix suchowensis]|nr:hypothetical protein IMY05_012G0047800 [Salix suchowensis]
MVVNLILVEGFRSSGFIWSELLSLATSASNGIIAMLALLKFKTEILATLGVHTPKKSLVNHSQETLIGLHVPEKMTNYVLEELHHPYDNHDCGGFRCFGAVASGTISALDPIYCHPHGTQKLSLLVDLLDLTKA